MQPGLADQLRVERGRHQVALLEHDGAALELGEDLDAGTDVARSMGLG